MQRSVAALPVFFSPGNQQSGRRSRVWPDLELPWCSLLEMVVAGQGRRQLFGNHAHVCKYFDADPFFQGKMGAGHAGLLPAARCLTLSTRPESRPVLSSFHILTELRIGNEHLAGSKAL